MYDDRCIAVYDSGAGGLNITKRIRERFKSEDIVYFSDRKNLPYGDKSDGELRGIIENNIRKINGFCPKLIIVACNTVSLAVREYGISSPVRLLGVYPKVKNNKKTLLICTERTAKSDCVKELLRENKSLTVSPQRGFAEEIEKYLAYGVLPQIKERFKGFHDEFDFVSLGCTHYSHMKREIGKIFNRAEIIDGADDTFLSAERFLKTNPSREKEGKIYFTDKNYERIWAAL